MKEGIYMKKGLALFLGMMLLAGCSTKDADEAQPEKEDEIKVEQTEEGTEVVEEEDDDATEVEETEDADDSDDAVAQNDDLKDFPEYNMLAEKIDLNEYKGNVKTDNQGNRIILFEDDDGEKEYKSIFIKNDNRLKIIEFEDGNEHDDEDKGLIYNEVIK